MQYQLGLSRSLSNLPEPTTYCGVWLGTFTLSLPNFFPPVSAPHSSEGEASCPQFFSNNLLSFSICSSFFSNPWVPDDLVQADSHRWPSFIFPFTSFPLKPRIFKFFSSPWAARNKHLKAPLLLEGFFFIIQGAPHFNGAPASFHLWC